MELKSIAEEAVDCRAAFARIKVGALVWHCHHGAQAVEVLTEPAKERIAYILINKPHEEQALRLRCFRPVTDVKACVEWDKARAEWIKACVEWDKVHAEWVKACAEWDKARAEWVKACAEWDKARAEWVVDWHAKLCGCDWDGKTIFGVAK